MPKKPGGGVQKIAESLGFKNNYKKLTNRTIEFLAEHSFFGKRVEFLPHGILENTAESFVAMHGHELWSARHARGLVYPQDQREIVAGIVLIMRLQCQYRAKRKRKATRRGMRNDWDHSDTDEDGNEDSNDNDISDDGDIHYTSPIKDNSARSPSITKVDYGAPASTATAQCGSFTGQTPPITGLTGLSAKRRYDQQHSFTAAPTKNRHSPATNAFEQSLNSQSPHQVTRAPLTPSLDDANQTIKIHQAPSHGSDMHKRVRLSVEATHVESAETALDTSQSQDSVKQQEVWKFRLGTDTFKLSSTNAKDWLSSLLEYMDREEAYRNWNVEKNDIQNTSDALSDARLTAIQEMARYAKMKVVQWAMAETATSLTTV